MKNVCCVLCGLFFFLGIQLFAQENVEDKDEIIYKFVPLLSSNPTSGTGIGAAATALYTVDDSAPSQVLVGGQYTDSKSYSIVALNRMYFDSDRWQSKTLAAYVYNNTSYNISEEWLPSLPPLLNDKTVAFNVNIFAALQQFLYLVRPSWYVGGQLFYIDQRFDALNGAGELFLKTKGISNSKRGGYGMNIAYDTRSKKEKLYPMHSTWIDLTMNHFPIIFGAVKNYYNGVLNARKYISGLKKEDVVAMQLYVQASSKYTPDGALAALGARNILRGFPIGKYKARNMAALQGEYRYRIATTRWRASLFGGAAVLNGGSYGNGSHFNREGDNGEYYSSGVGVHYILSKKENLDYRLNVAYSSDKETSVYASINQAF